MQNTAESLTNTFGNLITMFSIPVVTARALRAFDDDDHAMVEQTAAVFDTLIRDLEDYVAPGEA